MQLQQVQTMHLPGGLILPEYPFELVKELKGRFFFNLFHTEGFKNGEYYLKCE